MTINISEELPARKQAPVADKKEGGQKPVAKGKKPAPGKTEENSAKRIRQAVYDIRYRARREDIDLKAAFSQYMSNTSMSPAERSAVKEKLFGKKGGMSEQFDLNSVDWAVDGVANAMFKVFVEGVDKEEQIELEYEKGLTEEKVRKYKIRVTDPKNDRSYVRYADREKISALRARGLKVEMTEHGDAYEGGKDPRKKPEKKAKKDYDGDGKVESGTAEYMGSRDKAIKKAMASRTQKEEVFVEKTGTTSTEGKGQPPKIDVGTKFDNYKEGKIKIFPQDPSDTGNKIMSSHELEGDMISEKKDSKAKEKFLAMIAKKKGKEEDKGEEKKESACEEVVQEADTMVGVEPPKKVETPDRRGNAAMINVMKNKLRAGMGIKNPIVMVDPDEVEDKYEKMATSDEMKTSCEENNLSITDTIKKIVSEGGVPSQDGQVGAYRDAARRREQNRTMQDFRDKVKTGPVREKPKPHSTGGGGYNKYKLPTRPADGSGTGI